MLCNILLLVSFWPFVQLLTVGFIFCISVFCDNRVMLNLSQNQIRRLPKELSQLTHLVNLDLSKNCLEEVPEYFGMMQSLRVRAESKKYAFWSEFCASNSCLCLQLR
jgi:hypothetical protein